MRGDVLLLAVFLAVFLAVPAVPATPDVTTELLTEPLAGIAYTPDCLVECHLPVRFTFDADYTVTNVAAGWAKTTGLAGLTAEAMAELLPWWDATSSFLHRLYIPDFDSHSLRAVIPAFRVRSLIFRQPASKTDSTQHVLPLLAHTTYHRSPSVRDRLHVFGLRALLVLPPLIAYVILIIKLWRSTEPGESTGRRLLYLCAGGIASVLNVGLFAVGWLFFYGVSLTMRLTGWLLLVVVASQPLFYIYIKRHHRGFLTNVLKYDLVLGSLHVVTLLFWYLYFSPLMIMS